jgi:beta-glucosidase
VKVSYARGSVGLDALPLVPASVLRTPDGQPGLQAAYYPNAKLKTEGQPFAQAVEPGVDLPGPPKLASLPADNGWSAIWTGTLTPRKSGLHVFTIQGGGSGRLYLDGALAARFDRVDFGTVAHATARLTAGKPVKLRIEYTPRESAPIPAFPLLGTTLGVVMKFGWQEPDDRIAEAVAAARRAQVAVVFAADRHGEGADRSSLNLPGDQDALIAAVAAANPRTIVVLSTGGPVAMPWASKVSAIVEMWYSGDVFGGAASRILFGDAAPQGRLPITFPKDRTQGPGAAERNYPGLAAPDGAIDATYFDE